jgi:hypothetical protein
MRFLVAINFLSINPGLIACIELNRFAVRRVVGEQRRGVTSGIN